MIVDSSVWIAHLRGSDSLPARRLASALQRRQKLAIPDIVLMEVLRGARDATAFLRLEHVLLDLPRFVPADSRKLARNAAHLYARCRWSGFTPRSGNDCLIACCAIEARQPLLHDDRDFHSIAEVEPQLALVP